MAKYGGQLLSQINFTEEAAFTLEARLPIRVSSFGAPVKIRYLWYWRWDLAERVRHSVTSLSRPGPRRSSTPAVDRHEQAL